MPATDLERTNLEAHVDLCAKRYDVLETRLGKVEIKVDAVFDAIQIGQQSMTKVIVGSAGTIVAGLLSTVVVLLMN